MVLFSTSVIDCSMLEANLLDMFKLGVVDILLKIIQTEEKESRREALAALATFSGNGIKEYLEC